MAMQAVRKSSVMRVIVQDDTGERFSYETQNEMPNVVSALREAADFLTLPLSTIRSRCCGPHVE